MNYLKNTTTLRYDPEKCTGCRKCTEVCPQAVFEMRDKKAALTDRNRCMECGACALNCDSGALSVGAGVGCAGAIIKGMLTGREATCGCDGSTAGAAPDQAPAGCC